MIRVAIGIVVGMTIAAVAQTTQSNLPVTMTPLYVNAEAYGRSSDGLKAIKVNAAGEVICAVSEPKT